MPGLLRFVHSWSAACGGGGWRSSVSSSHFASWRVSAVRCAGIATIVATVINGLAATAAVARSTFPSVATTRWFGSFLPLIAAIGGWFGGGGGGGSNSFFLLLLFLSLHLVSIGLALLGFRPFSFQGTAQDGFFGSSHCY